MKKKTKRQKAKPARKAKPPAYAKLIDGEAAEALREKLRKRGRLKPITIHL